MRVIDTQRRHGQACHHALLVEQAKGRQEQITQFETTAEGAQQAAEGTAAT